jgi:pimeloyl-ACP methyl ester carboxylesterase
MMARGSRSSRMRSAGLLVAGAVALGGAGAFNHLSTRRSEARHPPRGRFVEVDGVRLHYVDRGAGSVIVLLHGNAVTSDDFVSSGLLDQLARTHRVIAFDRPGYGYSDRPRGRIWTAGAQAGVMLAALSRLDIRTFVVLGHSWGALVAAEMGLREPQRVAGAVLMSGYYRPTPRPDPLLAALSALPLIGDLLRHTLSPLLSRLMTPLILATVFAPAPVSASFRQTYPLALSFRAQQLRATTVEGAIVGVEAMRVTHRLRKMRPPVLILSGADDHLISCRHHSGWLARRLPGARFHAIPGAGHMVHHTAAQAVCDLVKGFALEGRAMR